MWDKLKQPRFTTFRATRRDRDWAAGEMVKVVFQQRSPSRLVLGIARIASKERRRIPEITKEEAVADGFADCSGMLAFLGKSHPIPAEMNKLTLEWIERCH